LPATFDAREQWPNCKSRISEIRDQAQCGSCWAVSAAIVATDRTCILSNGAVNVDLSQQDVLTCCGISCGYGCNGGYPIRAMQYWAGTGLVTGGNYGDRATCSPYTISPTAPNTGTTPQCVKNCQASYRTNTWPNDKHKAQSGYYVSGGEAGIRQEIFTHGPVQAAFNVYADFMHYQSGVYQHVTGGLEGGHAVTIIGWGTEGSTPYWLVKNQWNTTWGDQGYFKIIRGTDDCGFESGVVAGVPVL
jgi:cathepsin B